jgi:hypothetical protein
MECEGYNRMEAFYQAHENSLLAEIADLKDMVGDFGLCNDYLDSKVLELKDRIEHQRVDLRELHEKEKQWGIRKLYLETHCDMLEKEIIEANIATAHNYRHLVEYMKYIEFHKDKADRIGQAWIDSDRKHVKEIVRVQDVLPPGMRKKARKQTFRVEPT